MDTEAMLIRSISSPQGRIFQVEYAQEAVKQGSVVVGLTSKNHVVLCAVKVRKPTTYMTSTLSSANSELLVHGNRGVNRD